MIQYLKIWAACLLVIWGWACPAGAGSITALPSATVAGDEIRLGEVARVEGPDLVRQALEEVSLGRSPKPGKVRVLTQRQILSALRSSQDLAAGLALEIPDRVYVRRESQPLPEADARLWVEDCLGRQFRGREVVLEQLDLSAAKDLPVGQISLAAAEQPRVGRDGRFTLGLEVFVNGQKADRIRLSGRAAVFDTLVVTARKLSQGHCLSDPDVTLVRANILTQKGEGFNRAAAVLGQTLTQSVDKGELLQPQWLKPTPLVRKGDVVTLVAKKGSILIQTAGVSKEDGAKDSLIEVENIRSGKIVRGLVREAAFVEVVF